MYIFGPYYLSFIVCPSILDDLSTLVMVASPSSHPDLLRIFKYIIRVIKVAAYHLRGEVHVDFSGSNVDNSFDSAEERTSKDDRWIVLVSSHVNDLKIVWTKWSSILTGTSVTIPSTFQNVWFTI